MGRTLYQLSYWGELDIEILIKTLQCFPHINLFLAVGHNFNIGPPHIYFLFLELCVPFSQDSAPISK